MSGIPPHRKVLVIEEEPEALNALYVLLAGMQCEGEVVYGIPDALAKISRATFDAVVLDLRCSEESTGRAVARIKEIRASLVGRLLVITGDVTSPDVLDAIERQCLPKVRRRHLIGA